MSWDAKFMALAAYIASWSKDKSAQCGCVIVGPDCVLRSTGYNGFPRGIAESAERQERPAKYRWTEHAERNAIYNASRISVSLVGCTLYVNWLPCADCARAIVQTGIIRVVGMHRDKQFWGEELAEARSILKEGGVKVDIVEGTS